MWVHGVLFSVSYLYLLPAAEHFIFSCLSELWKTVKFNMFYYIFLQIEFNN